jgi:hypothetical protein
MPCHAAHTRTMHVVRVASRAVPSTTQEGVGAPVRVLEVGCGVGNTVIPILKVCVAWHAHSLRAAFCAN